MTAVNKPLSRSLRIYQKAALIFVVVALLSLLVVLYLSVSRAIVHIVPKPQVVSTTVSVEVTPTPKTTGQVSGYVLEKTYTTVKTFWIPEEGAQAQEKQARGQVTLINETGAAKNLVATTRILSEEGVLFRLSEAVVIPANGQVEAEVYADVPGASGEIGPTQFTIPGLLPNTQSVIYAVSVDAMEGGVEYVRVVSQSDLDQALTTITDEILVTAKTEMQLQITNTDFDGSVFLPTVTTRIADVAPGTEAGSFTISASINVVGVFYDKGVLADYVEADLYTRTSEGYQILSVNENGVQITVQSADAKTERATLSLYLDGYSILAPTNAIFDKSRLVGKSSQEVMALFSGSPDIASVTVSYTPFWLKRIPTLKDHITISIKGGE